MSETETLKAELIERIEAAETEAALEEIRIAELGKKGRISDLLKGLGKMSPDERREAGPRLNGLRRFPRGARLSPMPPSKRG